MGLGWMIGLASRRYGTSCRRHSVTGFPGIGKNNLESCYEGMVFITNFIEKCRLAILCIDGEYMSYRERYYVWNRRILWAPQGGAGCS